MAETLKGTCLVRRRGTRSGSPGPGYCHCTRCSIGRARASQGFVAKENFRFTKGEDLVKTYESHRAPQLLQQLRIEHHDDLGAVTSLPRG